MDQDRQAKWVLVDEAHGARYFRSDHGLPPHPEGGLLTGAFDIIKQLPDASSDGALKTLMTVFFTGEGGTDYSVATLEERTTGEVKGIAFADRHHARMLQLDVGSPAYLMMEPHLPDAVKHGS